MFLGEFEHIVLLAVLALDDGAYGVTIRREIEQQLDRPISPGALYTTLDRLEEKGLLSSETRSPDAESQNTKRCFEVTRPRTRCAAQIQTCLGIDVERRTGRLG